MEPKYTVTGYKKGKRRVRYAFSIPDLSLIMMKMKKKGWGNIQVEPREG